MLVPDQPSAPNVLKLLEEKQGCSPEQGKALLDLLQTNCQEESSLKKLEEAVAQDEKGKEALQELLTCQKIIAQNTNTSPARGKVKIDLSVARGLGYYTGLVFETTIDNDQFS